MQTPGFLNIPTVGNRELQLIVDTLEQGDREGLASWKIKLAMVSLPEEEKQAIHDLFLLLWRNLGLAPDHSSHLTNKFLRLIRRRQPFLDSGRVILTLGLFEEIVIGLLDHRRTELDVLTGIRWLHSMVLSLAFSHFSDQCKSRKALQNNPPGDGENPVTPSPEEAIITLDTFLLESHSLEEILTLSVRHIADATGFKRSALFWYSPVTRTVEGIHSHQVDLSEVRRVRTFESNIPGITWAVQESRPLYVADARLHFPLHYVKQFQLESLLVAPLHRKHNQPFGFLLLDRGGERFVPTTREIDLLEQLISRVSLTLRTRLYESVTLSSSAPPVSPLLTHREQEILQMIAYGYSTRHIGETLHLSEHTAAEYAQAALRKLNAKNRPEAVAKGLRLGLIK
ncbi:helix-turn-helix transcriptional regulator [Salinithrix halophila]|uniref:LuxR C-terminal-related transcriptional regulator n=1 Tax=Salinithrix halophila TaxID=1485204 RepID=A0ABV8JI93_9BACL